MANDEICVIFIEYEEDQKTRRIFNKVNRSAKATTRADNIITSEDDGFAVVTHHLVRNDAPLGIIYGPKNELIVKDILAAENIKMEDRTRREASFAHPRTSCMKVYDAAELYASVAPVAVTDRERRAAEPGGRVLPGRVVVPARADELLLGAALSLRIFVRAATSCALH